MAAPARSPSPTPQTYEAAWLEGLPFCFDSRESSLFIKPLKLKKLLVCLQEHQVNHWAEQWNWSQASCLRVAGGSGEAAAAAVQYPTPSSTTAPCERPMSAEVASLTSATCTC